MTLRPDPINKYAYNMLISLHPRQQYRRNVFYLSLMLLKRNSDGSYISPNPVVTGHVYIACESLCYSLATISLSRKTPTISELLFIQMNNYGNLNKLVLCNFERKLSHNCSVHFCLLTSRFNISYNTHNK